MASIARLDWFSLSGACQTRPYSTARPVAASRGRLAGGPLLPVPGPLAHSYRPVSDRRQEPTLVRTPRSKLSNARQGGQAPARRDLNGWSHRMSREERMKT